MVNEHRKSLFATIALLLLLAASACSPSSQPPEEHVPRDIAILPTPDNALSAALETTPYPYLLPLPQPTPTVLDGLYIKVEPDSGPRVPCKRCPDYAPEGGSWTLRLDRGVYRIYHEVTGWGSVASYVLSQNRNATRATQQIVLFNDPVCPEDVGLYNWNLEGSALTLQEIEDPCAIRLRAKNLTSLPWVDSRSAD